MFYCSRNAQVTFVKKPQLKIIRLQNHKRWNLIHAWSDKALKDTTVNRRVSSLQRSYLNWYLSVFIILYYNQEALLEELEKRDERKVETKVRKYNKKMKQLRMSVRSSLYKKDLSTHTHKYKDEVYHEDKDRNNLIHPVMHFRKNVFFFQKVIAKKFSFTFGTTNNLFRRGKVVYW